MKPLALVRFKYTPFGGAENYLARLTDALEARGVKYRILSTNWEGDAATKIPLARYLPSFLRILRFASAVCFKKSADETLFSLERIPCADVYRAGDGVHRAWIDTRVRHGESPLRIFSNPLQFTYLHLEKRTFENASKIIANSHFVKNDIVKYYGIDDSKIEVVYNGVPQNDVDENEARRKIEEEFGIKAGQKIILFVGSGFMRKGGAEFLSLVSKLKNRNFTAIIVGKEKNIKKYKHEASKLGVNAIFTGARRDADMFYAAADIFLFPTRYEPFSNVCLEAMAGGCAVVTTAQNGASEILDEGFIMKNPQDMDILGTLERLLEGGPFLGEIKAANRAKSLEFSVEQNLDETLKVLEAL